MVRSDYERAIEAFGKWMAKWHSGVPDGEIKGLLHQGFVAGYQQAIDDVWFMMHPEEKELQT
jgi:hypothetical protein